MFFFSLFVLVWMPHGGAKENNNINNNDDDDGDKCKKPAAPSLRLSSKEALS